MLILYELWAGERLVLEKAVPRYRRPVRPSSVSLCALPGGIGRFMLCDVGANHCRLSAQWLGECGRGLTSGPRESASERFLNELLLLLRYPPRSAAALLEGTLPLRYCFW